MAVRKVPYYTNIWKLVDNTGDENDPAHQIQDVWFMICEIQFGQLEDYSVVTRAGMQTIRICVLHVNQTNARKKTQAARARLAAMMHLCAHLQVDIIGGDFNSTLYRYFADSSNQKVPTIQGGSWYLLCKRLEKALEVSQGYPTPVQVIVANLDEAIQKFGEEVKRAFEGNPPPRLPEAMSDHDKNRILLDLERYCEDSTEVIAVTIIHWDHSKEDWKKDTGAQRTPNHEFHTRLSANAIKITNQRLGLPNRDQDAHAPLNIFIKKHSQKNWMSAEKHEKLKRTKPHYYASYQASKRGQWYGWHGPPDWS